MDHILDAWIHFSPDSFGPFPHRRACGLAMAWIARPAAAPFFLPLMEAWAHAIPCDECTENERRAAAAAR